MPYLEFNGHYPREISKMYVKPHEMKWAVYEEGKDETQNEKYYKYTERLEKEIDRAIVEDEIRLNQICKNASEHYPEKAEYLQDQKSIMNKAFKDIVQATEA